MREGTRWLLLKNPENLDSTKNEHRSLREAMELNQPLATAYHIKEDLRQFWEQPNKAAAEPIPGRLACSRRGLRHHCSQEVGPHTAISCRSRLDVGRLKLDVRSFSVGQGTHRIPGR